MLCLTAHDPLPRRVTRAGAFPLTDAMTKPRTPLADLRREAADLWRGVTEAAGWLARLPAHLWLSLAVLVGLYALWASLAAHLPRGFFATPSETLQALADLLNDPRMIRTKTGGSYKVYTPFARAVREAGPDKPVNRPRDIAIAADLPKGEDLAKLNLAPDMRSGAAVLDRHALPAGEDAAAARLERFLDHAKGYGDGRDRLDMDVTSGLAEALALGEISPRTVWARSMARIRDDRTSADDARKFLSEVLWREFAWHLLVEFPQMDSRNWREDWMEFPWKPRGAGLEAWQQARTGIPAVDAGLREMRVTGRMHNRVRMIVASYLTKHLMIDWRAGLRHFADSLTDWDPASNAMNWQWVAGS